MRHKSVALSIFLLVCSVALAASAQQSPEMLAAGCTSCHGAYGKSSGKIPSIASMDKEAFVSAMQAYRSGERKGTVMNRIARGYSDAQIETMAAYFIAPRGKR